MAEFKVKIPDELKDESERIESEVKELVSAEEKRKLLSLFINEAMKGAGQLSKEELIKLGREIKEGRSEQLQGL